MDECSGLRLKILRLTEIERPPEGGALMCLGLLAEGLTVHVERWGRPTG